ncbi:hypothetical protein LUX57_30950 [Actinomadura madurae]|uniref:hypothetical protein n=1 Tax=Actinomadura madurae TaxID=1993 RepID=UPI0020D254BA|nr:hypothetical protein [Actinomadura madurae]MCP9969053.1 hypothetical protein [Actinomadura madurae]
MTMIRTGVRIVLVHGKKPTPHSIVWKVLAEFGALGAHIETWQDAPDLPRAVFARADLVILRSVHPATAASARASAPAEAAWCNAPGGHGDGRRPGGDLAAARRGRPPGAAVAGRRRSAGGGGHRRRPGRWW